MRSRVQARIVLETHPDKNAGGGRVDDRKMADRRQLQLPQSRHFLVRAGQDFCPPAQYYLQMSSDLHSCQDEQP